VQEHATALADTVEATLPGWVERSVARIAVAWTGSPPDTALAAAARRAGAEARADVGAKVRALVETDVDDQRTTPLSLLRGAVRYPTAVLREAGVPPVERDELRVRLFPEDLYDLAPATFADVDPRLAEPGLAWGAAKAFVHLQRHGRPSRQEESR
jgi:hypothetical protein